MLLKKIIIHHITVVTKSPSTLTMYLFQGYFLSIAKLYICIVLVNVRKKSYKIFSFWTYPLPKLNNSGDGHLSHEQSYLADSCILLFHCSLCKSLNKFYKLFNLDPY